MLTLAIRRCDILSLTNSREKIFYFQFLNQLYRLLHIVYDVGAVLNVLWKSAVNRCKNKEFSCPVEATLSVIGGRWKSLILWNLRENPLRFSELQRSMPNISQRMLTNQLRELENDGVIKRTVFAEVPPRVEYELTKAGKSLHPIMEALCDWGQKHYKNKKCGSTPEK